MSKETITISFWNILFDVFRPEKIASQQERMPSILQTIAALPKSDIYGFTEIEGTDHVELLAQSVGAAGYHGMRAGRENCYIGAFAADDAAFDVIQIDENRYAIVAEVKDVRIVVLHLSFSISGETVRKLQLEQLLDWLGTDGKPVVLVGDFNSMSWQRSRRYLRRQGYSSVLKHYNDGKRVVTSPVDEFRMKWTQPYRTYGKIGFDADDIYVKGLTCVDSGTLTGSSDHKAIWATLKTL